MPCPGLMALIHLLGSYLSLLGTSVMRVAQDSPGVGGARGGGQNVTHLGESYPSFLLSFKPSVLGNISEVSEYEEDTIDAFDADQDETTTYLPSNTSGGMHRINPLVFLGSCLGPKLKSRSSLE